LRFFFAKTGVNWCYGDISPTMGIVRNRLAAFGPLAYKSVIYGGRNPRKTTQRAGAARIAEDKLKSIPSFAKFSAGMDAIA
jgi:hypothetical protein